jgi:NSS family neurotransmitter:Na+ symporter
MRFQKPTPWSLWRSRDVFTLVVGSALGIGNFFAIPSLVLYSGGAISLITHFMGLLVLGSTLLVGEIIWSRWLLRPYWNSYQVFKVNRPWLVPVFSFLAIVLIVPPYLSDLGYILFLFSQSTMTRLLGAQPWIVQGFEEQLVRFLGTCLVSLVTFFTLKLSPAKLGRLFFLLVMLTLVCVSVVCTGIIFHWGFENISLVLYWDDSKVSIRSLYKNLVFSLFTLSAGFGVIYHYFYYASQKPIIGESDENMGFWKKPGGIFVLVAWVLVLDLFMSVCSLIMISPFATSELQKMSLYSGGGSDGGHFVNADTLILDWVPLVLSRASGGEYLEGCLYLGLLAAGMAAVVSLLDLCVFSFEKEMSWSRNKSARHVLVLIFLSLGITLLTPLSNFLKFLGAEIFLPVSSLILCFLVGWRMPKRFQRQIVGRGLMLDRVFDLWRVSIRYLTPGFIIYYLVSLL